VVKYLNTDCTRRLLIFILLAIPLHGRSQNKGFRIEEKPRLKEVAVYYNNVFLTAYCFYDSVMKPFLFPLNTPGGITITRGYPLKPLTGERTDHPHHTGLWMNYESVNGLDFWNNSTAIPVGNRHRYGTISHKNLLEIRAGPKDAIIRVAAAWLNAEGQEIVTEQTTFHFSIVDSALLIDRTTTLNATDQDVLFKDAKDGLLGLRVARELELPSMQADVFVDALGNKTAVAAVNNEGVTGNYITSEGVSGDSAWGTKGNWTLLTGAKDKSSISIGIVDHPGNVGYPAYRHARGYGLFAINPLGRKVFSNGKEELNFVLQKTPVTFRYRIVVRSGTLLTPRKMNAFFESFSKVR